MFQFILRRLGLVVPTFIGITLLTFSLIRMIPGDPIEVMAGERGVSAARHAELSAQFGFDQPLYIQYFRYVDGVLHGDLGNSLVTKEPVVSEFLTLFPATVELATCAAIFAILVGLPSGIIAAVKRGTIFDHSVMTFSLTGYSMPIFWWALLLMLIFSVTLGWTPVSGRIDVTYWIDNVTGFMLVDSILSGEEGAFVSAVSHLVLPSIVLGTIPMAVIARMTRSSMLEVLSEDYIRTARSKGIAPWRVIVIHALRNALIPVITVIGLQVGILLSGAILTETVFAWPGIGKWLIESIGRRDYPVVQGGILIVATIIIVVNLLVDIAYGIVNPRIRHAR